MYRILPMFPAANFQLVNDNTTHPDFRLVAAFFLGWVFLSSLRYVWFSAFIRALKSSWKGTFRRLRVRRDDSVLPMGRQCEKAAGGTYPHSFHLADSYPRQQRNPLVLLLCLTFLLGSLFSFLSLLTFRPKGSGNVCAVVVAAPA
ncbi:hypothetical protein BGW80DRAFT_776488 [Lactifluus volemus]|nr:hypothetical protein BGW80DRAFT_776488 [Lactifluus volemus]